MGVTTEEEPDAEAIVEADLEARSYKRLFFLKGEGGADRLVGAILIGKMKGRKKILELISSRAPVDQRHAVFEMLAMPEVPAKAPPST